MTLTDVQENRARGMILGAAVGDALGAGYEFMSQDTEMVPDMIGGGLGPFAPGEWTDDTSQTYVLMQVVANRKTFDTDVAMDDAAYFLRKWAATGPPDIGGTTARVLCFPDKRSNAKRMQAIAGGVCGTTNGSLMRTAPVVLPYLEDPLALVSAAMDVSSLTHASSKAMQACALWCLILRHAVMEGTFDPGTQIDFMPVMSRDYWAERVHGAELNLPWAFEDNGKAVIALQAALSSVIYGKLDFVESLNTAIRIGHDTDTVASIAGALVGAINGIEAIPAKWLSMLHGYPGKTGEDLDNLVVKALA